MSDPVPVPLLPAATVASAGMASLSPGDAGWASRAPEEPGARHRLLFEASGWRYVQRP